MKRYDEENSARGNFLNESIIMYAHTAQNNHFEAGFVNVKFFHVKNGFQNSGQEILTTEVIEMRL
jgi:hypothetical protein